MKKLQKLALNNAMVMTSEQMKHIAGGAWQCSYRCGSTIVTEECREASVEYCANSLEDVCDDDYEFIGC